MNCQTTSIILIATALLLAPNEGIAANCKLGAATYGNIGGDYELRFGPEAVSTIQNYSLHLVSLSQKIRLSGDIYWTNGYAVPRYTVVQNEQNEEEIAGSQVYTFATSNSGRVIARDIGGLDSPAPPLILLPGLNDALWHSLNLRDTGGKPPNDLFYLARCT